MNMKKAKKNNKKEFHRYRHYHLGSELKIPSVTVMVTDIGNSLEGKENWNISWAICQPEDNFNKKTGRNIAKDTMDTRSYEFMIEANDCPFTHGINMLMMSKALTHDIEVRRFRNAMDNLIHPEDEEVTCQSLLKNKWYAKFNRLKTFLARV